MIECVDACQMVLDDGAAGDLLRGKRRLNIVDAAFNHLEPGKSLRLCGGPGGTPDPEETGDGQKQAGPPHNSHRVRHDVPPLDTTTHVQVKGSGEDTTHCGGRLSRCAEKSPSRARASLNPGQALPFRQQAYDRRVTGMRKSSAPSARCSRSWRRFGSHPRGES
jgi:hypothetical protein